MSVLSLLHVFVYIWFFQRIFFHLSTVHDFSATENSIRSLAPSVYPWAKYQRINLCLLKYCTHFIILNYIDFAEVSHCFPFCSCKLHKGHHCLFLSSCSLIIQNHRCGCTWGIVAQLFGCKTWESSTSGDAQKVGHHWHVSTRKHCRYYIKLMKPMVGEWWKLLWKALGVFFKFPCYHSFFEPALRKNMIFVSCLVA